MTNFYYPKENSNMKFLKSAINEICFKLCNEKVCGICNFGTFDEFCDILIKKLIEKYPILIEKIYKD